jgi:hypothetical protein
MSFSGFGNGELQGASLKNSPKPKGQKLKGKRTSHSFASDDDPVAGMMPDDEPAPITDQAIKRAQKQKDQATERAQKQKMNKNQRARSAQKSTEKPVSKRDKSPEAVWLPEREPEETKASESKTLDMSEVAKRSEKLETDNKLRRAALSREVQTRTATILQEANKLKRIDEEIKKLDQLLAYDVSLLRDKIDISSVEYSKAKTRFTVAEKEFKEAKTDYEAKTATKDELVNDLMTLIQENEERKKEKLEVLVRKLDMSAGDLSKMEAEEAEIIEVNKRKMEEAAAEAKRKNDEEERKRVEAVAEEKRLQAEKLAEKIAEELAESEKVETEKNIVSEDKPVETADKTVDETDETKLITQD